jgi:DNA repair protein RadC
MPLTIVRDGPVATAACPHCRESIDLAVTDARWRIRGPADVADRLVLQLGGLEREELHVLLLNTKNIVLDQVRAYQGNISSSLVRVGELFSEAVRRTASGIVLVHNHPSGDATPSPDDLHLTAEAIAAGRLLDIDVLDHLIIAGDTFVSLREYGIAFDRRGPAGAPAGGR